MIPTAIMHDAPCWFRNQWTYIGLKGSSLVSLDSMKNSTCAYVIFVELTIPRSSRGGSDADALAIAKKPLEPGSARYEQLTIQHSDVARARIAYSSLEQFISDSIKETDDKRRGAAAPKDKF
jgi:hypothetical protein